MVIVQDDLILFAAGTVVNLLNISTKKTTKFQTPTRQNISSLTVYYNDQLFQLLKSATL